MTTDPLADALAELRPKPVAWKYRWKIDGEYVNWRYSDASNAHPALNGYEEVPLYEALSGDLMLTSDHLAAMAAANEAAATVALNRHEAWMLGDGFTDGDGFPAVSCDVTACENVAAAIRALTTADQQAALDQVKREAIVAELQALVRAWSGEGELDEASTRIALRIAALADGEPT